VLDLNIFEITPISTLLGKLQDAPEIGQTHITNLRTLVIYDMFFVESKSKLNDNSVKSVEQKLLFSVGGTSTIALLSLRDI
jgi:hypothetical protein